MAQPQGFRIETPENAEANARINQQAINSELAIARRILKRYMPPHTVLRTLQYDREVQKELTQAFRKKLGYDIFNVGFIYEDGRECIRVEGAKGIKNLLVDELENELAKLVDLVAHTQAERWYTKQMQELYPLAYVRAHRYGRHSVN